MYKLIRFDKTGCAYGEQPPYDYINARNGNFVSFSNEILLNMWADSNHNFHVGTNGVCTENFFEDKPWYFHISTNQRVRYWWGNDCLKKIHHSGQNDLITGACPFVYSNDLYRNMPTSDKFQAVFLPKSDGCPQADSTFTMKTELADDQAKMDRFLATIENLKIKNPIFIAFPSDYMYWERKIPRSMIHRLFSLGFDRYDPRWNKTMISLFNHCSEMYFHIISTPSVYASYMGKKVNFYSTELLELNDDDVIGEAMYTLDKNRKPPIFHEFMEYITHTFQYKTSDMNYWIHQFMSLDLIKDCEELQNDLLTLESRSGMIRSGKPTMSSLYNELQNPITKTHPNYNALCKKVKEFNTEPSELAAYYFNLL